MTTAVPDYTLVVGNPPRVIGYECECDKWLAVDYKSKKDGQVRCERCAKQFKIEASQLLAGTMQLKESHRLGTEWGVYENNNRRANARFTKR